MKSLPHQMVHSENQTAYSHFPITEAAVGGSVRKFVPEKWALQCAFVICLIIVRYHHPGMDIKLVKGSKMDRINRYKATGKRYYDQPFAKHIETNPSRM